MGTPWSPPLATVRISAYRRIPEDDPDFAKYPGGRELMDRRETTMHTGTIRLYVRTIVDLWRTWTAYGWDITQEVISVDQAVAQVVLQVKQRRTRSDKGTSRGAPAPSRRV